MYSMAVPSKPSTSAASASNASVVAVNSSPSPNRTPPHSASNRVRSSSAIKRPAESNTSVKLLYQESSSNNNKPTVSPTQDFVSATASTSFDFSQQPPIDRAKAKPHRVEGTFDSALVEAEVKRVANERLRLVKYEPYSCKRMSQDLAAELMEHLKLLQYTSYKIIVMVSLGNRSEEPGLQFGSRCLWNAKTDRMVYVKHTNGSVYAVILVYALHIP